MSNKLTRIVLNFLVLFFVVEIFSTAIVQANPGKWTREGWKTDFTKSSIQFDEILSGGPPRDGIPAIDKPTFQPVSKNKDIQKNEPVISLSYNGVARAYPLRILIWHEIVNDTINGLPIAVTYCPLCNSAVVFKRTVEGQLLDFGTTGKLRNSDLVMYDRQTESWWQQFTGTAIVGNYQGTELETLPVRVEAFELFVKRFPDGEVLIPNNPKFRPYGDNPYFGYDSRNKPLPFFSGDFPEGISPMARVVVFKVENKPKAVSLSLLRDKKTLSFGNVTVFWKQGQNSALDQTHIAKGKDVGNVIVQVKTPDGLKDIVYDVTFAFVFHSFHKNIAIVQ